MEQLPRQSQGGEQLSREVQEDRGRTGEPCGPPHGLTMEYGYLSPIPPEGDSWDEWVIERGIEVAAAEDRPIDDRTAHYIAAQLHEGQTSALYGFASTGAISPDIHDELAADVDRQPEHLQRWSAWLSTYCSDRADKGPVEDWHQRTRDEDRAEVEAIRRNQTIAELDALFSSVTLLSWAGSA